MKGEEKCEPCTYSPEQAEDFLQTSSLDTSQLSLLSGMPTPAASCENEPQTDGFQACECGKGMCACSIHPSTPEAWIASMRDSLALILALPENKQGLALKREVVSTVKPFVSLASFDPSSCTWKTSQTSLLTDSEPFSQTWPRSGMTRNGYAYALPIVGRLTKEIAGGYWPTPTASGMPCEGTVRIMRKRWLSGDVTLEEASAIAGRDVRKSQGKVSALYPTPTAHDAKKGAYPSEYNRNTPGIAVILGGRPAPTFQEWQMGWPINHTALKQSAMARCRSKQPSPGNCSEAPE